MSHLVDFYVNVQSDTVGIYMVKRHSQFASMLALNVL